MRGLAALSVVLFHLLFAYDSFYQHATPLWWRPSPDTLEEMAFLPVKLFFMISGFVILMTIERAKTISDFVVSRFSRLYPAYWACALATLIFTAALAPTRLPDLASIAANLTMFQYYLSVKDIDPVYWSLIVEMNFYIAMALMYRFGLIGSITKLSFAWLIIAVIFSVFDFNSPLAQALTFMLNLKWASFFVAGIAFYKIWSGHRSMPIILLLFASLAVSFTYAALWAAILGAGFWGVFYLAISGRLTFLSNRLFLFLGSISYCLYLLHQNIGFLIIEQLQAIGASVALSITAAVIVALVLSTAVSFAIERPAQRSLRAAYRAAKEVKKLRYQQPSS